MITNINLEYNKGASEMQPAKEQFQEQSIIFI